MDQINCSTVAVFLAQDAYKNLMVKKFGLSNVSEDQINNMIFPNEWYLIQSDDTKMRILSEAINNNILILETDALNEYYKKL